MSAPLPLADPRDFLATVHPSLLDGEQIELRFIHPTRKKSDGSAYTEAVFYADPAAAVRAAERRRAGWNVHVGCTLRRGRDGTASGVSRAGAGWADIDAKLWHDQPDPKAAALAAIQAFPYRPTALVGSGGGYQPWWTFAEPTDLADEANRERLKQVSRALALAVCGPDLRPDPVQDLPRVLRLPGTLNHKYTPPRPVELVWLEPERRYDLLQLEHDLRDRYPWTFPFDVSRLPRPIAGDGFDGDDEELLARARTARNGPKFDRLFAGDWAGYPSESEGRYALLGELYFWTGGDPDRMERLARRSGFATEKFDTRRGGIPFIRWEIEKRGRDGGETYTPMPEPIPFRRHADPAVIGPDVAEVMVGGCAGCADLAQRVAELERQLAERDQDLDALRQQLRAVKCNQAEEKEALLALAERDDISETQKIGALVVSLTLPSLQREADTAAESGGVFAPFRQVVNGHTIYSAEALAKKCGIGASTARLLAKFWSAPGGPLSVEHARLLDRETGKALTPHPVNHLRLVIGGDEPLTPATAIRAFATATPTWEGAKGRHGGKRERGCPECGSLKLRRTTSCADCGALIDREEIDADGLSPDFDLANIPTAPSDQDDRFPSVPGAGADAAETPGVSDHLDRLPAPTSPLPVDDVLLVTQDDRLTGPGADDWWNVDESSPHAAAARAAAHVTGRCDGCGRSGFDLTVTRSWGSLCPTCHDEHLARGDLFGDLAAGGGQAGTLPLAFPQPLPLSTRACRWCFAPLDLKTARLIRAPGRRPYPVCPPCYEKPCPPGWESLGEPLDAPLVDLPAAAGAGDG